MNIAVDCSNYIGAMRRQVKIWEDLAEYHLTKAAKLQSRFYSRLQSINTKRGWLSKEVQPIGHLCGSRACCAKKWDHYYDAVITARKQRSINPAHYAKVLTNIMNCCEVLMQNKQPLLVTMHETEVNIFLRFLKEPA